LVVADHRVGLDEHVGAGAGVVGEPGQGELLGPGVAAHLVGRLQHGHLQSRPGQVGGAGQAIVTSPDDHHVGGVGQRVPTGTGGHHGPPPRSRGSSLPPSRTMQAIASLRRRCGAGAAPDRGARRTRGDARHLDRIPPLHEDLVGNRLTPVSRFTRLRSIAIDCDRGGTNMLTSMTRRHLTVAAVGSLLVVGLAACGGDDGSGGSEDPIRIGASLPLTGEFSQPGQAALEGYEIWRDLVNEKGGLLGRPVELVIKDDASNQNTVVADYNALISQDRVDLLLGTFSSLLNLPASAVAERNQMLYVEPAGGSPEIFSRGF